MRRLSFKLPQHLTSHQAATLGADREALVNIITSGNTFLKSEQVGMLMTKYMKSAYEQVMLHVTRHTSHVTHHTSHVTHHTSHITITLQVKLVTQCMFRIVDQSARKTLIGMMSPEAQVRTCGGNTTLNPF